MIGFSRPRRRVAFSVFVIALLKYVPCAVLRAARAPRATNPPSGVPPGYAYALRRRAGIYNNLYTRKYVSNLIHSSLFGA